ncbi:hypothetical protein GQR58_028187 [Nymphon striatum]|nr:hypothetical protein GQR58_028187 [Nymphon striatum]
MLYQDLKGLLLYTLIGIAATVVMQSSHATLVLIITALASQQITYENALALAIGSNVGTTITAIIGSISANINGKRLAAAHLVFNLITGLVAIALIAQLVESVDWLSNHLGIDYNNYTLKLAPIPVNIREEYTNKIKGLYAAIVSFIGKANEDMTEEQSNEVFELRSAGRDMLESIKSTQHLHKNLSKNLNNANPYVRDEYNKIRYRIGAILRSLSEMKNDPDEFRTTIPTLEALKINILEQEQQFMADINQLISEKRITGAMATSLMNDNSYTNNIANKLIDIGSILFKSQDLEMHEVEESLRLDEQETVEAVATRKAKEKGK